jgi:hypothetical protein
MPMSSPNNLSEPGRKESFYTVENFALAMMLFDWESRQGLRLCCQKEYGWKISAVMLNKDHRSW